MWSITLSMGILARVVLKDDLTPEENHGDALISWLGSYQVGFAPWRDATQTVDGVIDDVQFGDLMTSGFRPWS